MFLPHPRVKVSIVGSLRDREVACSASDRQGSNFDSCVWRAVSSQSSHHPQEVLLAQFSLYVHKGGLKPDSFHFHSSIICCFRIFFLPAFTNAPHSSFLYFFSDIQIFFTSCFFSGIFPPDFSSVLPSYLSVYVGVTASLMVTARLNDDDQPAIIREMTNIIESEYTFSK